ncbi:MAG: hypothetical protein JWN88_1400 [Frankiales bacterium]|nr:hypothetical protein [Frankiales bacterium]
MIRLVGATPVALVALVALAGCSSAPAAVPRPDAVSDARTSLAPATPSPSTPSAVPSPPAPPVVPLPAAPGPAPVGTGQPLQLPPGPATPPRTPVRPPGSLVGVDWQRWAHAANCPRPDVGTAVAGDLDGDGTDEVAVPLTCPGDGASSVAVYAGDAAAPRALGDALPREEQARVQGVQFRDAHLVVGAFTWPSSDHSGEPDTAVTTRWVVREGRLVRTDRWEDPAHLLEVDEEH